MPEPDTASGPKVDVGDTPTDIGSLWQLLKSHLGPYRNTLWAVVGLQFIQTIANLYLPTLNRDIIDTGIVEGDTDYIQRIGLWMLVFTVIQILFAVAATYYGAKAAMGFGRDVRRALFHQVTDFSAQEVNEFGSASLITRITNDVTQVQMLVLMTCTLLVAAPITMIGGVFMALRQDVGLSVLLVVSIPVLVLSVGVLISRMIPQFRDMQDRIDAVNRVLREQLIGIRIVRAFVREPDEVCRFERSNDDLTETSLAAGRLQAAIFPIVVFVLNGSSAAAVWIGGDRIGAGDLDPGQLVAFLNYLVQILLAVMMGTFMAILIPRAAVSAGRIQEVLRTPSTVVGPRTVIPSVPAAAGVLEFRGAGFHYPGAEAPVLADVSLLAEPGKTTAIIGSTGSGKTTMLSLVPRLFDVTQGSVLVDGVDIRDLDLDVLWSRVGLVPQKPYLFSGTVASNLRVADPDATDDDLWVALDVAQARDFVAAMPDGLNSRIAQGGSNVSGGQRQRLAIARALIRKPRIYLFDDSFSALDLATDARIRAAIREHIADATVVIVGQRVSSIKDADQILVLEDGRQVALGTHDELVESSPTYQEIVESQYTEALA